MAARRSCAHRRPARSRRPRERVRWQSRDSDTPAGRKRRTIRRAATRRDRVVDHKKPHSMNRRRDRRRRPSTRPDGRHERAPRTRALRARRTHQHERLKRARVQRVPPLAARQARAHQTGRPVSGAPMSFAVRPLPQNGTAPCEAHGLRFGSARTRQSNEHWSEDNHNAPSASSGTAGDNRRITATLAPLRAARSEPDMASRTRSPGLIPRKTPPMTARRHARRRFRF
jgi:hypothetical protein